MDRPINVLVYPSGAESSLEVWYALKNVVNVRVLGASSRSDHAELCFQHRIEGLGNVHVAGFAERLRALIAEHTVDAIFPCHDTVAEALAQLQPSLSARIVGSPAGTARLCRSKLAMQAALEELGMCPPLAGDDPAAERFPLFAKPDVGEGGKGAALLGDRSAYDRFFAAHVRADYLVSEYLPGEEFTVECFTDRHGRLRDVGPRTRERVLAGISVRTRRVAEAEFRPLADAINGHIALRGLWFFQVKRDRTGALKLLEVSTRTASSMGLHRAFGVNLPLLALYDALDKDVQVAPQGFEALMDRALTPKYRLSLEYDTVYLDFDDTLLMNGHVHGPAIQFAYQCHAHGKRLVLITKHEKDLRATLAEQRIAENLFHDIIHLRSDERKSDHIQAGGGAIFIDNAHSERADVAQRRGIPVFDVDAIAALIDHHA
ncbi:MAG: ATP-grasp domain-containing protein [Flavobacteriales bacterium]|nr:ATP-grasp domain-containing protein [Flavobacteriales bacterium]